MVNSGFKKSVNVPDVTGWDGEYNTVSAFSKIQKEISSDFLVAWVEEVTACKFDVEENLKERIFPPILSKPDIVGIF